MSTRANELNTKPPLYNAWIHAYNHPQLRDSIPTQANLSYPVPDLTASVPTFQAFHYAVKNTNEGASLHPLTRLKAHALNLKGEIELVSYQRGTVNQPIFDRPAYPFSYKMPLLTGVERQSMEIGLYLAAERLIGFSDEIPMTEAVQAYVTALNSLVFPELIPLYRALDMQFAAFVQL